MATVNNASFFLARPANFVPFRDKCLADVNVAITERIWQLPIREGTYNQLAALDKFLRKNKLTDVALIVPQLVSLFQAITHSNDLMLTEAAIKCCSQLYYYNVSFDKRLILHSGRALTKRATSQCYPFAVFLNCKPFL